MPAAPTKARTRWRHGRIAVNAHPTVLFGLPALIHGGLGIVTADASDAHGLPAYSITHLATGNGFGVYFDTLRAAKRAAEAIIERLPEIVNSDSDRTGAYPFETRAEWRKFLHSLPKR